VPTPLEMSEVFEKAITEHLTVIQALRAQQPILARIAADMTRALVAGKKVLWCGNGGSAADSQHLAAELVGRFRQERRGLASVALTTDTSILTAIGNDYGYEEVFRRQVEALCVAGDMLVGISTSGNSKNVCLARSRWHLPEWMAEPWPRLPTSRCVFHQRTLRAFKRDTFYAGIYSASGLN
jgi:D-sedoheptulose 7-phosphate isomerase